MIKGWKLTSDNIELFLENIKVRFHELTKNVYDVVSKLNEDRKAYQRVTRFPSVVAN